MKEEDGREMMVEEDDTHKRCLCGERVLGAAARRGKGRSGRHKSLWFKVQLSCSLSKNPLTSAELGHVYINWQG